MVARNSCEAVTLEGCLALSAPDHDITNVNVSIVKGLTYIVEAKIRECDDCVIQKLGCSDKVYKPNNSPNKPQK
jgi:hypothetical protein